MKTCTNPMTLNALMAKTWMWAAIFTVGNMLLPQVCHLVPNGGHILLPIYFFTLVATMLFGWQTGLIVAVASPVLNTAIFGMPAPHALPLIIMKGALLVGALYTFRSANRFNWLSVCAAVICAYILGFGIECLYSGIDRAFYNLYTGFPGMLIQLITGVCILFFSRK